MPTEEASKPTMSTAPKRRQSAISNQQSAISPSCLTDPRALGYPMPAEWAPHRGTWLSWPHREASWPGKFEPVPGVFVEIVRHLAPHEEVHINVLDPEWRPRELLPPPGPAVSPEPVLLPPQSDQRCLVPRSRPLLRAAHGRTDGAEEAIVDWGYNAWGGKYPPFDADDIIPPDRPRSSASRCSTRASSWKAASIDVNGRGTLLTTESCLLNPNRNPALSRSADRAVSARLPRRAAHSLAGRRHRGRRHRRPRGRPHPVRQSRAPW